MTARRHTNKNSRVYKIQNWFNLRKNTTPAHWTFGSFCGGISLVCFPAGLALMCIFGWWEKWNDKCEGTKSGFMDWWEAFLPYCILFFAGFVISLFGVFNIGWWLS
jgi:uncharacterized membrane protein YesL